MNAIDQYLTRIGFVGTPKADLATLRALHRLHLLAIPYENLDVQFRRTVVLDPAAAFEKMVRKRRGGWCYEMNGLLSWALSEIGFKVTRMAAGVSRDSQRTTRIGNHLVLKVDLDRPYIADVGFGDGILVPMPMQAGSHQDRGFVYSLEDIEPGWFRFRNHALGVAPWFDFQPSPADESLLAATCNELQTSPESKFVLNLVCMRHAEAQTLSLLGRVRRETSPTEVKKQALPTRIAFAECLSNDFGIDLQAQEIEQLWETTLAREADLAI